MGTKKNLIVLIAVVAAALLFTTAWNVFAVAGDPQGWPPDLGPRLDGAWVNMAAGPNGPLVHSSFNVAQDPEGLRYTCIVEHTQCSASVWGMFPEANTQSQEMGVTEKTGPNTARGSAISYGLKVGGVEDVLIYISVCSWEYTVVDADHNTGQATLAYYLPQQDADHDGLPDVGQKPVLCVPYSFTATRVKVMPMCEPTPMP
jgi:hypothetical protein